MRLHDAIVPLHLLSISTLDASGIAIFNTYMLPVKKTADSPIFCETDVCSLHTIGSGKISIVTSVKMIGKEL